MRVNAVGSEHLMKVRVTAVLVVRLGYSTAAEFPRRRARVYHARDARAGTDNRRARRYQFVDVRDLPFRIVQAQADEIEVDQRLETAIEIGKQRAQLLCEAILSDISSSVWYRARVASGRWRAEVDIPCTQKDGSPATCPFTVAWWTIRPPPEARRFPAFPRRSPQ